MKLDSLIKLMQFSSPDVQKKIALIVKKYSTNKYAITQADMILGEHIDINIDELKSLTDEEQEVPVQDAGNIGVKID